jgi:hypothetical protein
MKNIIRTIKKYDYFFKAMTAYAVIFVLLYSCKCEPQTPAPVLEEVKKVEPVLNDPIIDSRGAYDKSPYHGVVIKQSGMRYAVVHVHNEGFYFINLTKDSLEVALLKKQLTWSKDSLQIEVSKKYLKN